MWRARTGRADTGDDQKKKVEQLTTQPPKAQRKKYDTPREKLYEFMSLAFTQRLEHADDKI